MRALVLALLTFLTGCSPLGLMNAVLVAVPATPTGSGYVTVRVTVYVPAGRFTGPIVQG